MADIYGNRPSGENFTKSVNKADYTYSGFLWDEYKYSILYSQMHKIASENIDADIFYNFYDDKDDEVLSCLSSFYNKNKLLIPCNLNLRLYKYNGNELKEYTHDLFNEHYEYKVQGEGVIDNFYYNNIKLIARCCGFDPEKPYIMGYSEKGISERFYGDRLKKFKNERILSLKNICGELEYEIEQAENQQQYGKDDWRSFITNLRALFGELTIDIASQEKQCIPSEVIFKSSSIKTARDTIYILRELQKSNTQYGEDFNYERNKEIIICGFLWITFKLFEVVC